MWSRWLCDCGCDCGCGFGFGFAAVAVLLWLCGCVAVAGCVLLLLCVCSNGYALAAEWLLCQLIASAPNTHQQRGSMLLHSPPSLPSLPSLSTPLPPSASLSLPLSASGSWPTAGAKGLGPLSFECHKAGSALLSLTLVVSGDGGASTKTLVVYVVKVRRERVGGCSG